MILITDIESNGLLETVTKIHCIVAFDPKSRDWFISVPDEWIGKVESKYKGDEYRVLPHKDMLRFLSDHRVVFHNGFLFDVPLVKKLYPNWRIPKLEDTFVLSSLFDPDRPGGHKLESWGESFGVPKPVHEDWSTFSMDMLHRCIEDVRITHRLWVKMEEERSSYNWEPAIALEYAMFKIQSQQEHNGVLFDKEAAEQLVDKIQTEISEIEASVIPRIPKLCECTEGTLGYLYNGRMFKKLKDGIEAGVPKEAMVKQPSWVKKITKADGSYAKAVTDYFCSQ